VPAAADLGRTVTLCARQNLGGMEGLIGVPGSVGGALRMNAGAYGIEIGGFVQTMEVFRARKGSIDAVPASEAGFTYRDTAFEPDDIMISAELELPSRPYEEIRAAIRMCNQKRRASQPLNEKSAGCIFKNPAGGSAGKMIDELGLKGHRIGGAVVSDRHANFFVNRYQATADDLLRLVDFVKQRIREAFGHELEEEVILWS
jgi:UDP-N-acetylmuramate dehydrogenase